MKLNILTVACRSERIAWLVIIAAALCGWLPRCPHRADETCSRPTLPALKARKNCLCLTLGVEGLGDGSDKLVVVDVKPGSSSYGKVIYNIRLADGTRRITAASPMTAGSSGYLDWRAARFSSSMSIRSPRNRFT
jgi:hypothetical protein